MMEIARYAERGYAFPVAALDEDETAYFVGGYRRVADRLGGSPRPIELFLLHLFHEWAWRLVTHPKILDAVEQVLGPNILVWDSSVFPKPPGSESFVSMHQDGTYWGLHEGDITTAWVALTASTRASGCMRVAPGSHRLPILPHTDTHAHKNLLTRGQAVQREVAEADIIDIELQPGEVSLHHVRLIHGSGPNTSDQPRIGYAVRYVTPEVKPEIERYPAILARGRETAGHWPLRLDPPNYPGFEEAHAAQQEAARRHLEDLT